MNHKIAAVVVLYNPMNNVVDNIHSYSSQVQKVIIVDNSDNELSNDIKNHFLYENYIYIKNETNKGIGYSLNIAAEMSMNMGYEYLLTMDQDSRCSDGMISKLAECFKTDKSVAICSPFHKNKFNTKNPSETKFENVFDVMTSGNLLSLSAYKIVGKFNEDYFIDYVDVEYCMRINLKELHIIRSNATLMEHNEGDIKEKKLFYKMLYPYNHSVTRFYYKTRNRLYLKKEFYKLFPEYFNKREIKMYRNTILKAILFEKRKLRKLVMIYRGFIDYKRNYKGKIPSEYIL